MANEKVTTKIIGIDLGTTNSAVAIMEGGKPVIIDEAVELAKEFGSQSSPKFINGALGAVLKKAVPKQEYKGTNDKW